MDAVAYKNMMKSLLPHGRAWEAADGGPLSNLLQAWGDGFARFDARLLDLLEEADPRTVTELINAFEATEGLPDPCTGALTDIAQRRAAIWQKITSLGGQSLGYFTHVALTLGFTVTIEEFKPFVAGDECNREVCNDDWHFVWFMHASAGPDDIDLQTVQQCVVNRLMPAHTIVHYTYDY